MTVGGERDCPCTAIGHDLRCHLICVALAAQRGGRGGAVVKVLRYESEGRWLDSRWCHWNFSVT